MDFDALRQAFFDAITDAQPEDATTLGLRAFDGRLRSSGPEGVEPELSACRALLRGVGEVDVPDDDDARRDADAMQRLSRFRLHTLVDRREHLADLELSLLPVAAVHHLLRLPLDEERIDALNARLTRIPAYLKAHERALALGRDEGHHLAPEVREMIAGWALPEAARGLAAARLERLGPAFDAAAAALTEHAAFIADTVATSASGSRLGPEELDHRIEASWGIPRTHGEIMEEAEDALITARASFLERARLHDPSIRDAADADRSLSARFSDQLARDEVRPLYERALERARSFAKERALFSIPDDFRIAILELAPGMAGGPATNFPAPLLGTGAPLLALTTDPAAHPPISITNLAIHEGVPGHGLDSFALRTHFGRSRAPVRFFGVHDDLMIATRWVGPMLRIEGFAVYVEELFDREGFYEGDPEGAMFLAACQAIRAGRLLADLELHGSDAPLEEVASRFATRVGMPLRWARMQCIRYLRVPLQATTYHLGGRLVRARVEALEQSLGSRVAAHAALFREGPTLSPQEAQKAAR